MGGIGGLLGGAQLPPQWAQDAYLNDYQRLQYEAALNRSSNAMAQRQQDANPVLLLLNDAQC